MSQFKDAFLKAVQVKVEKDAKAQNSDIVKKITNLSDRESRLFATKVEMGKILFNSAIWEDPGHSYFKIIEDFIRIVHSKYYIDSTRRFERKLIKNLAFFKSKYHVYCLVFSWYNRLEDNFA